MREIHIGKEIERRVAALHMKKKDFAAQFGIKEQNVKRAIFDKPEIDTGDLKKICEILNFNFFQLYSEDERDYQIYAAGGKTEELPTDSNADRMKLLEMLLAEKERLIQYLMGELEKTR